MNTEITTLEQAATHLIEQGVVDMTTMRVEGKQLLDVCGYSYTDKNWGSVVNRQIKKHKLLEDHDFFVSHMSVGGGNNAKKKVVEVTMNAANHILLAAITDEGKQARQDAIDTQVAIQNNIPDWLAKLSPQAQLCLQDLGNQVTELGYKVDELETESKEKSDPVSISKLVGRGVNAQMMNMWLRDQGYIEPHFEGKHVKGWSLTTKGIPYGVQINDQTVLWKKTLNKVLPCIAEIEKLYRHLTKDYHKR